MPGNQPYTKYWASAKVKGTFGNFSIIQESKG